MCFSFRLIIYASSVLCWAVQVCVKPSSASSIAPSCTKYASQVSIKDNLIENKEKLNDLNDQIMNNHQHKKKHSSSFASSSSSSHFDLDKDYYQPPFNSVKTTTSDKSSDHASDPDIRFTRKKLGEKTKAGYISIAIFLGELCVDCCDDISVHAIYTFVALPL